MKLNEDGRTVAAMDCLGAWDRGDYRGKPERGFLRLAYARMEELGLNRKIMSFT
jgi:hypothetical protein